MYYHIHPLKSAFTTLLLLVGAVYAGHAQKMERPWYVGVQGGTSFGQATFVSITENRVHLGAQGGLFAGYRFNRLLSVEASFQLGAQNQSARACCPYWLSVDGERYMAAVLDGQGWYYKDLDTRTRWNRVALQANFDLLSLFVDPASPWSVDLSPQIAFVSTKNRVITPDEVFEYPCQAHFGYGLQLSAGYRLNEQLRVSLYGGFSALTGQRFDNIPVYGHTSNLIWDAGFRLTYSFGRFWEKWNRDRQPRRTRQVAYAQPSVEDVYRLTAELAAAERSRVAAEEAARLAREEADRAVAALEEAARLAREADAARERALLGQIPVVYFADNSKKIQSAYEPALQQALSVLQQYPDVKLEIHAYSSKSGSKYYNTKLSRQRMEVIRRWFAERGVAMERMEQAFFHGVDYQASNSKTARRAELKFVK